MPGNRPVSDMEKLLQSYMDIDDDPRNVFLKKPNLEPPRSKVVQIIDKLKQKFITGE